MTCEMQPITAASPRRYRVVGTTVRGASHERRGGCCQDAHVIAELPDGAVVVAVADGAGSASVGQLGAVVAAQIAVSLLKVRLQDAWPIDQEAWRDALQAAAIRAHVAIVGTALAGGFRPEDLATTLILAVISRGGVALLQIGDGGVVADRGDGQLGTLVIPEPGQYANETVFLTAPDFVDHLQTTFVPVEPAALAIFSDGLQRLGVQVATWTPHGPFFEPLFGDVRAEPDERVSESRLREFLGSPRVRERTDDDLTLVVLVRQPIAEHVPPGEEHSATETASATDPTPEPGVLATDRKVAAKGEAVGSHPGRCALRKPAGPSTGKPALQNPVAGQNGVRSPNGPRGTVIHHPQDRACRLAPKRIMPVRAFPENP